MIYLGVDTGGTFTDFVLWQDGQIKIHKVLSTPEAPEQAILQGMAELGLQDQPLRLVHGSTVATNAVLEGKGVKTVFITNRGFADLLSIGRQNRAQLYELQPHKPKPPLPPEHCLETGGRLSAQGEWIEPLTAADIQALLQQVHQIQPQAVAVNLLFSWLNDQAEQRIKAALPDDLFISLSSEVLPEIKEYERGMATWLNAWVGPLVQGYLQRLQAAVPQARVAVMQSNAHTMAAEQAAHKAVNMLLSGPAGGLIGAQFSSGQDQILSFDMGGTSTDVALIDGQPKLTTEGRIADYPVAVPMVDMHTIGAGGGSIAWLDAGGMLQVGPQSAGASPGPACYGQGGEQATVTDAHLFLGHLPEGLKLGGYLPLQKERAQQAIESLAQSMDSSPLQVAQGIIQIANEHMARALRAISIQKGIDPQPFYLVSFGGAGGLHVCDLAEALHMDKAMVPVHSGVLSALGMLAASPGRHFSQSHIDLLSALSAKEIAKIAQALIERAEYELRAEGHADFQHRIHLDLRYRGQSYTLNLSWRGDIEQAQADFEQAHADRYGHRLDLPVELVNIRVEVQAASLPIILKKIQSQKASQPMGEQYIAELDQSVPVYERQSLSMEQIIYGPAIIIEPAATTWIKPGWQAQLDDWANLLLQPYK